MELKLNIVNKNCTLVFQDLIDVLPSAHKFVQYRYRLTNCFLSSHCLLRGDHHKFKGDKYYKNVIQMTMEVTR